jgi:hypothetical protein
VATVEGIEHQLDVVVATGDSSASPAERVVLAIGEAKSGQPGSVGHLRDLDRARASLGPRAAHARLMLFAPEFSSEVRVEAAGRSDVELIDLERLYHGE